jgi:hypothetical protein
VPRAPRKAAAPPVPVTVTLDIGPLTLSVQDVAWAGLARTVAAMMEARRTLCATWPELRDEPRDLGCVPGAGPLEVRDPDDYEGRRPIGY